MERNLWSRTAGNTSVEVVHHETLPSSSEGEGRSGELTTDHWQLSVLGRQGVDLLDQLKFGKILLVDLRIESHQSICLKQSVRTD